MHDWHMLVHYPKVYSLRIFAVFSVVISISGSVKYSEATHRPFSEPERARERESERGGHQKSIKSKKDCETWKEGNHTCPHSTSFEYTSFKSEVSIFKR